MKPHDRRRMNAFIKDEDKAVVEYNKIAIEMRNAGFIDHANLFFEMAEDEARHSEIISEIRANPPRYE